MDEGCDIMYKESIRTNLEAATVHKQSSISDS